MLAACCCCSRGPVCSDTEKGTGYRLIQQTTVQVTTHCGQGYLHLLATPHPMLDGYRGGCAPAAFGAIRKCATEALRTACSHSCMHVSAHHEATCPGIVAAVQEHQLQQIGTRCQGCTAPRCSDGLLRSGCMWGTSPRHTPALPAPRKPRPGRQLCELSHRPQGCFTWQQRHCTLCLHAWQHGPCMP